MKIDWTWVDRDNQRRRLARDVMTIDGRVCQIHVVYYKQRRQRAEYVVQALYDGCPVDRACTLDWALTITEALELARDHVKQVAGIYPVPQVLISDEVDAAYLAERGL
jgi:hypothetical protein